MEAIATVLHAGRQALLLLPEIGLAPQNLERLEHRFHCPIAVIHSGRTDRERLDAWLAARSGAAPLTIGTRSALWTPLKKPGLILVDEEHDLSFKQQDGFRYFARDVAVMRGKIEPVPVVLGSATPSLESLFNVREKRYRHFQLSTRAGKAQLPAMEILDLRPCRMRGAIAEPLVQIIDQTLQRGKQVLLFLGRRGYSPVLLCHQCGFRELCRKCDVAMTFHRYPEPHALRCHRCGWCRKPQAACPQCKGRFVNVGHGTQRIEETLQKLFPQTRIIRFDRDQTRRKGQLHTLLAEAHALPSCILVGTQMIAKGHHLKNLELVGILDLDRGLYSHSFRGMEIMAQQIIQVAGRAGRDGAGRVVLQTHHPHHPVLKTLLRDGYGGFARIALQERAAAALPPCTRMALLQAESRKPGIAHQFLATAAQRLPENIALRCFGPFPSIIEKRAGLLREQLVLTAPRDGTPQRALRCWLPKIDTIPRINVVRWFLAVYPMESC